MERLLEALRHNAARLGPPLGQRAFKRGLAVTQRDGTRVPIPVSLTPVVLDTGEQKHRLRVSRDLCTAAMKMARAVLQGPGRESLLSALSPLERRIAETSGHRVQALATARTDFFVSDRAWALEVNATIPAMQGYSDIAAHTFIESVGGFFGLDEHRQRQLIEQNGSNARALHDALRIGAERESLRSPKRIGMLCRRNDAQISELEYLVERFNAWGTECELIFPDQLEWDPKPAVRGRTFDLIYRHLFVRRLEESPAPAAEKLLSGWPEVPVVLLNPPASPIEVKITFALMSEAGEDPELAKAAGLSDEELDSIRRSVPWTRRLKPGAATLIGQEKTSDLVGYVAEHPDDFVLKRAWDYGGKAVFVGMDRSHESFAARVSAAFGQSLDWSSLCRRAAVDPAGGGFIVQRVVRTYPEPHVLCVNGAVTEAELYVDYSAYASVGLPAEPAWGGVCRGSTAQIVNIVGGGGVLPLLTAEVATELATAAEATSKRVFP